MEQWCKRMKHSGSQLYPFSRLRHLLLLPPSVLHVLREPRGLFLVALMRTAPAWRGGIER